MQALLQVLPHATNVRHKISDELYFVLKGSEGWATGNAMSRIFLTPMLLMQEFKFLDCNGEFGYLVLIAQNFEILEDDIQGTSERLDLKIRYRSSTSELGRS